MLSVFRITRAEFTKVFKKPTVYIMAFILALVLVISLVTYSPTVRSTKTVSIDGDSAGKIYSVFMGDSESSETKQKFDSTYIDFTNNKITFYKNIYNRNYLLSSNFEQLKKNYNNLKSTYESSSPSIQLPEMLKISQDDFTLVLNNYGDMTAFAGYEPLSNVINYTNASLAEKKFYETKYFDIIEGNKNYNYNTLKNDYIPSLSAETSVSAFIQTIEVNNYIAIYENMVKYGEDIMINSLHELLNQIRSTQSKFINLVISSSQTESNKAESLSTIENMKTEIGDFKSLIDGLTSNKAVYAIHTKKDYENFTAAYNEFQTIYEKVNKDQTEYKTKQECVLTLKGSNFLDRFETYLNKIKFINSDKEFVEKLETYQKLAETNQKTLLESISGLKTEISTSGILDEITNYMLMGEAYTSVVDKEVLKQLSTTLSLSDMNDAKNIDLSDYNEYNNRNNISQLTYQLENNIYSNEIGGTFSLNQTISTKENMLDFTYYSLKICTLLIIIFTVMMIANLITSETDSGTIKLLLIRPYRRGTILFGKILATFFFSLAFLLFAFVVSLTAGYFMFGLPSVSQVLVTFNATKSFLINPFWLILIFFASCAGDILFYLIIALTVSVLFKSYIGAISTSLLIYVGSLVVGGLLANSPVYAYLPFTNISWFRFFGGEIMPSKFGIGTILASPVHSFQNIWLSIGISVGFSIILSVITFISFKKRDF